MISDLGRLSARLGLDDDETGLLEQALTHKSYANEREGCQDNERLEFLGDAVISLAVSDYLLNAYPEATEGRMAKLRAAVVCQDSLADAAREISLGEHVRLSRGEEKTGGRNRVSLLCDAFEAVMGAVYLMAGWEKARALVLSFLRTRIDSLWIEMPVNDAKSQLQEYIQEHYQTQPEYELVASEGPDHAKHFVVRVNVEGDVLGNGEGTSKKRAAQKAAALALKRLAVTKRDGMSKDQH